MPYDYERPYIAESDMPRFAAKDRKVAAQYGGIVRATELTNVEYRTRFFRMAQANNMKGPPDGGKIYPGYLVVRHLGTVGQYETWMPDDVFEELYVPEAQKVLRREHTSRGPMPLRAGQTPEADLSIPLPHNADKTMTYDEIAKLAEELSYRDKFRLAQLLIQLGRKEEEEQYPEARKAATPSGDDLTEYVYERLVKMRPSKKGALLNTIGAMFQFQGGISDSDKDRIVEKLQKLGHISIDQNDRVTFASNGAKV